MSASEASLPTDSQLTGDFSSFLHDLPPKSLYKDSAAKHVDARANASVMNNAEGSIATVDVCV
jgi:hypothetical protein